MGQSLVKNYIHIVFSTKLRKPFIDEKIENELFAYLGGVCNKLDCTVLKVGGYLNHVHILCMLSKNITLSKLLQDLKSNSSKWIKTKGENYQNFFCKMAMELFLLIHQKLKLWLITLLIKKNIIAKRIFKMSFVPFWKNMRWNMTNDMFGFKY